MKKCKSGVSVSRQVLENFFAIFVLNLFGFLSCSTWIKITLNLNGKRQQTNQKTLKCECRLLFSSNYLHGTVGKLPTITTFVGPKSCNFRKTIWKIPNHRREVPENMMRPHISVCVCVLFFFFVTKFFYFLLFFFCGCEERKGSVALHTTTITTPMLLIYSWNCSLLFPFTGSATLWWTWDLVEFITDVEVQRSVVLHTHTHTQLNQKSLSAPQKACKHLHVRLEGQPARCR